MVAWTKKLIKINIIFNMSDIECVFESMAGKGSIFISNYAAAQDISLLHCTSFSIQQKESRLFCRSPAVALCNTAVGTSPFTFTCRPRTMKSTNCINSSTRPSISSSRHVATVMSWCTVWREWVAVWPLSSPISSKSLSVHSEKSSVCYSANAAR